MSRFLDKDPQFLPKMGKSKTAFLSVIGTLEKIAIIEEGEGHLARNYSDLDLSNSIYTGKDE